MRKYTKALFFLIGILLFSITIEPRISKNKNSISILGLGKTRVMLKELDSVPAYQQLPDGEYQVIEVLNPDNGTVLIRQFQLTREIDFVVTGVPKELLSGHSFKIIWV